MFDSQFTLFDQLPAAVTRPTPDPVFETIGRTELAFGAWIDLAPGWLSGHATLFDEMAAEVDWRQPEVEMYDRIVATPRLVASIEAGLHPALGEMTELLSERYGRQLDRISANWYRNGDDSVAWHGDRIARDLPEATVATVSLRGPREFRYKPADGGPSRREVLGHGDLVVMGGSFQRTWRHAVPKAPGPVPPRMVIMFRHSYD
jgi:alkylated DNA repair dioxygenase AlkB